MVGSHALGKIRSAIMNKIVMDKWRQHIVFFMNSRAPFNLSGIDFKLPVNGLTLQSEVDRRMSFHKYQMDILSKTAEPMQIGRDLDDDSPLMLFPWDEHCLVTWKIEDDLENEFYPHQIV